MTPPFIYALMAGGFLGLTFVMWFGFRRDLARERNKANAWREAATAWCECWSETSRELRNERTLHAAHRDLATGTPIGGRR